MEFKRVFRVQGMDSNTNPKFQMVPSNSGKRYVALRDGAGATVISVVPAICTIVEIRENQLPADDRATGAQAGDRYFCITGTTKGVGLIMVTRTGLLLPLFLEVGVKDKREQLVMFHFVSDNARHRTRRPPAVIGQWLPDINYIWKRQANVVFVRHGSQNLPVAQNLQATITHPEGQLGTTGTLLGTLGDQTVNINVFFIWVLQNTNGTDTDALTTIGTANSGGPGICMFEDDAGSGQMLSFAHELGHHMGLDHPGHRQIDLMWDFSGQRGLNLTKADVNTANP